jgi:hypothetical protein
MRLATVDIHGKAHFGAITPEGFVDLGAHFGSRCEDVVALFKNDLLPEVAKLLAASPAVDHPSRV